MTATTDFDRLLGAVLEADGPQGLPAGLVDAALADARIVGQRRPFFRLADRLGWPPLGWPVPRSGSRRFALLALVALLGAAVVASLLVAGGGPRRLVGDGERIYVWANRQAHLIAADDVSSYTVPAFRGDDCATLVPGTMLVTRGGFGQWHVIDLSTNRAVGSVSTDYGGGERWAPGAPRLAQFDVAGRVGLTTFVDPTRPITRWIPVEGVVDVDWSLDGERLAAIAIREGTIHVVVIDATNRRSDQRRNEPAWPERRRRLGVERPPDRGAPQPARAPGRDHGPRRRGLGHLVQGPGRDPRRPGHLPPGKWSAVAGRRALRMADRAVDQRARA